MNGYLVPANAKKGTLIFNIFRPFDLILFGSGTVLSLLMLAIMHSSDTLLVILSLLPVGITGLLVFPIPNYHNVLCALQSVIRFYEEKSKGDYKWRGWCFYEKFPDDSKSKK